MTQRHYINGRLVRPPYNYEELSLEVNYDNDNIERNVNVTSFEWVEENYDILRAAFNAGTTGGNGVFEGIPHRIEIEENGTSLELFDGYIDLTTAEWDRDRVTTESVPRARIDWLNDVADSFTFEYLRSIRVITDSDYIYVPYVISSIPNYIDTFVVTLTITYVTQELTAIVSELTKDGAVSVTGIDSAAGVLGLIFKILYLVTLLIVIVELILDLINLIIQPIKYKPAMRLNKLIEKGCQFLGMQYQSLLLQSKPFNKLVVIPESFSNPFDPSDSRIKGFILPDRREQNGYFIGTFGELLREVKTLFNARIRVEANTLNILPANKIPSSASFTLPPYDNPRFRTNASEMISNYLVSFSYDVVEKHTIDNWEGNNVQVILQPNNITDKQLQLTKGAKTVQTKFARATEKTKLTVPEQVADVLLNVLGVAIGVLVKVANTLIKGINAVVKTINAIKKALAVIGIKIKADIPEVKPLADPGLANLIDGRIGLLVLEQDMITVPKLVMLDVNIVAAKTKIASENRTDMTAEAIYDRFHKSASFAPSAESAQRYEYQYENVEMNLTDVQNVMREGFVKLSTGEVCEVMTFEYNPSSRLAIFVIRQRKLFANSLSEVKLIPSGR